MNILAILFLIGPCGFLYLILALQVSGGFPPFYQKGNTQEEMQSLMPLMIAICLTLAISTIAATLISDSFTFMLVFLVVSQFGLE